VVNTQGQTPSQSEPPAILQSSNRSRPTSTGSPANRAMDPLLLDTVLSPNSLPQHASGSSSSDLSLDVDSGDIDNQGSTGNADLHGTTINTVSYTVRYIAHLFYILLSAL